MSPVIQLSCNLPAQTNVLGYYDYSVVGSRKTRGLRYVPGSPAAPSLWPRLRISNACAGREKLSFHPSRTNRISFCVIYLPVSTVGSPQRTTRISELRVRLLLPTVHGVRYGNSERANIAYVQFWFDAYTGVALAPNRILYVYDACTIWVFINQLPRCWLRNVRARVYTDSS